LEISSIVNDEEFDDSDIDPDYEGNTDDEGTTSDSSNYEMEDIVNRDVAPVQAIGLATPNSGAAANTGPKKAAKKVRKVAGRAPAAGPDEELRVYLDPPVERADGDTDKDSGKKN